MRINGHRALLACAVVAAACSHAMAQSPATPKRLGILAGTSCPAPNGPALWKPLLANLAGRGWIEGQTLIVDCVLAGGRLEQAPALAVELVARRPDVLLGASTPTVRALKQASATIPIVTVASDPLRSGLVSSLAHPDGNVTGLSPMSFDLVTKRVELLKAIVPRLSRLAIIYRKNADPIDHEQMEKDLAGAAGSLGISWRVFYPAAADDIEPIFARLGADGFDAAYVLTNPVTYANRKQIAQIALKYRIPTVSEASDYARDGILLTYGLNTPRLVEGAAEYIDKLLRGAKPAELPLQQATTVELVINLKTAKALGLSVPPAILARSEDVIE